MKNNIALTALIFMLLIGLLAPVPAAAPAVRAESQGPFYPAGFWTDEFKAGAPLGPIYAIARDPRNGDLYVGGSFRLPGRNIARWDGARWSALGSGTDDIVTALVFDHQGNLYVGGQFIYAGGLFSNGVARWDGQKWYAMISDAPSWQTSSVEDLAVDSRGLVYAVGSNLHMGGYRTASVMLWDGTAWYNLGGTNAPLKAVAVDSRDHVYVAGRVRNTVSGDVLAWDGAQWSGLGADLRDPVNSINVEVFDLLVGPGDELYIGGRFAAAGTAHSPNVAVWKDGTWATLGAGAPAEVHSLALHPDGSLSAGSWASRKLYQWDGAQWSEDASFDSGCALALLAPPDGSLVMGGCFSTVNGQSAPYLARRQGGVWSALISPGASLNNASADIAWINGRLYAAGLFGLAGNIHTGGVTAWDGAQWSSVGGGLNGYAQHIEPDGRGGFYVGGVFTQAGATPARQAAHWNGSEWQALGSGLGAADQKIFYGVGDLALSPDGSLYALESFAAANGTGVNRVTRWDGVSWTPLVTTGVFYGSLLALAVDQAGNLYLGGSFTFQGSSSSVSLARWDGTAWTALSGGPNGDITGLLYNPVDNSLYAAGSFSQVDGQSAAPVARWSISEQKWYPTQAADMAGVYPQTLSLDPQNQVIIAANRQLAGGRFAPDLAWCAGGAWQWLGARISDGSVTTRLAFASADDFYLGGDFSQIDGHESALLGHWQRVPALAQDFGLSGLEDIPLALLAQTFSAHFLSVAGLAQVRFTQLPASGALRLGDQPVTLNQTISLERMDQLTFVPPKDFNGDVQLSWVGVSADGHASEAAAVALTFASLNDDPLAVDDSVTLTRVEPAIIRPLANDSDIDSPTLSLTSLTQPQHGSARISGADTIEYVADAGYSGADEFTYTISDGQGGSAQARIRVMVKLYGLFMPMLGRDGGR